MFSKYGFKHKMDGGLLRVTYTGTIFRKEMEEIMDKVYKLIREHRAQKILINALDSDVKLELFESLAFAKEYPLEFKQAKTAVVEKQEKKEQYRVHETFADNRSFNMKFFNSIADAENWLGV